MHLDIYCFGYDLKSEKYSVVFLFTEQEFAKNIMRAAETAKSTVSQQVSLHVQTIFENHLHAL